MHVRNGLGIENIGIIQTDQGKGKGIVLVKDIGVIHMKRVSVVEGRDGGDSKGEEGIGGQGREQIRIIQRGRVRGDWGGKEGGRGDRVED